MIVNRRSHGPRAGPRAHRDILTSSVAATIAAAIMFVSRMAFFFGGSRDDEDNRGGMIGGVLMMILGPIAVVLIQIAIPMEASPSTEDRIARLQAMR
jgi:hypothetical protein